ncbi:MAG: VOC family protein [Candidatus Hydrogenedentes bacterium]|nr:VOC family protein [Candidatus Hydrogenedentota bacterium]
MSVITEVAAGTFCWPELCSADAKASKKFYSALFDWESDDLHMPEGDYTFLRLDGQRLGSMYQMKEERKLAGILPHWNSYVAVTDADEAAKTTTSLGGKVLTKPFDADGDRMANLQDPTGAKFCVWEARKQSETVRLNEIGALCWTELYTHDTAKASAFYAGLFGWRAKSWDGGPTPYTVFEPEGQDRPFAGMLEITEEMQDRQPQWIPYFQVGDTDKIARQARKLRAQIYGPVDIPTIGRMAMIVDPQGAHFAVITLNCQQQQQ